MSKHSNCRRASVLIALGLALATVFSLALFPLAAFRPVSPDVVAARGVGGIRATTDLTCTAPARQINLVLVVGTGMPGATSAQRSALASNVKQGLAALVNHFDIANGSQVGLIIFHDEYTARIPLRGGPDGFRALSEGIGRISMVREPSVNALGPALAHAGQMLAAANPGPGVGSEILVVYADAPLTIPGNPGPPMTPFEGCRAAQSRGATVTAIEIGGPTGQIVSCTGTAGHFASTDPEGQDLPERFESAASAIFCHKPAAPATPPTALPPTAIPATAIPPTAISVTPDPTRFKAYLPAAERLDLP